MILCRAWPSIPLFLGGALACDPAGESVEQAPGQALTSAVQGYVTTASDDPYVNRCAVDPAGDLDRLADDPAYVMAYSSGRSGCGVDAPSPADGSLRHHQGIQRLHRAGRDYLLVTDSVHAGHGFGPGFELVEMGSRTSGGFALGSGGVTTTAPPSCNDRVVRYLDTRSGSYDHAGGLQVSGAYAVVPFESTSNLAVAGFRLVNLGDPGAPVWGETAMRRRGKFWDAGTASLTRLADSRFLLLISGNDADEMEVLTTDGPVLCVGSSCWKSRASITTPFGAAAYQNIQIVNACDGALYLLGTYNNGAGEDRADLWQMAFP